MDDLLADGIADDWQIFDDLRTLKLVHRTTQEVDFDTQQVNSTQVTEQLCKECLVRMLADRDVGTVRQIFERGKSIDADSFATVDTIITIPKSPGRVIEHMDCLIETDEDGSEHRWDVIAIDTATLRTRYRLACRRV